MTVAAGHSQTTLKCLAGVLFPVCLVLFLLAIEQKQTVAAWQALRDGAAPAARAMADEATRLFARAADGVDSLVPAIGRQVATIRATRTVPAADDRPPTPARPEAGDPLPAPTGSLSFVRAELRFPTGETLHTRPLRIAYGRDFFAPGQTFAGRLNASADAQIELREIVAPTSGGPSPPPFSLCGGEAAGVVALLYRTDSVVVMLFRGPDVGPDTPPTALCGVWSFAR